MEKVIGGGIVGVGCPSVQHPTRTAAIMAIAITDTVIIRSTISTTTDPTLRSTIRTTTTSPTMATIMARHIIGITGIESITTITIIIITTTIKLT
jgi:hypothetical protein